MTQGLIQSETLPGTPIPNMKRFLSVAADLQVIKKLRSKTWLCRRLTDGLTPGQTDGRMDGQTDERTNRTDENYIPLQHTSYAWGIIIPNYDSHASSCLQDAT